MSWSNQTLGDYCEVIAGQSPEGKYYNSDGKGVPFYQGKKEFGERFIGAPQKWTTKVTKEAVAGDILMSVRAPVGPINFSTENICIGRGLAAIRPSEKLDKDFIFYYLLSKQDEIVGSEGAVFASINKSQIAALRFSYVELTEQKRIVSILDQAFADLEQVRAKTEQNLKNARELFDSYLQQVFSQDREVAAKSGWVTKYISDVICKTKTVDPRKSPESEFLYVDVSGVSNQTLEITDSTKLAGKDAPSRARRVITEGDIIFATVRPTLRRIAVVPSHLDGEVCSTGYFVFQPKSELYNRYLYYFLQSDTFMVEMEKLQKGASYPAVNDSQVKSRLISYPSIPEQKRIVETLDSLNNAVNELKATYTKKLNSIDDLKKSILQKAFSGELTTTAT